MFARHSLADERISTMNAMPKAHCQGAQTRQHTFSQTSNKARSACLLRSPVKAQQHWQQDVQGTDVCPAPGPFASVTEQCGFLPNCDPVVRLQHVQTAEWEEALQVVPKLCVAGGTGVLRRTLAALPPFPTHALLDSHCEEGAGEQLWRAYLVLSFLSHAYMWCDGGPAPRQLPAVLAVPWCDISRAIDMPPILVYATYNLLNWRRLDPNQPVELGNIVCLHNFFGGMDEEWFRLVHVEIEAKAAPAVGYLPDMQSAIKQDDIQTVQAGLARILHALEQMQQSLSRMGEKCDPYVYYQRVRQPMSGWRGNPALPDGLIYEGVSDEPVQLYGETGAQSSIVPAFDAVLGIEHQQVWLRDYLMEMKRHMPPAHRRFLTSLAHGPSLRSYIQQLHPELKDEYNAVVSELEKFRSQHKAFAYNYIAKFAKQDTKGTGGSDFMPALGGYRDTTARHFLD